MRVLRILVATVFLATAGAYAWFFFYNRTHVDHTWPEIRFDSEVLQVNVDAGEADLLRDVRAFDEKDGDLSGRVIVERISNFVEKGLCNVTYAVVDNDRHTTRATRRLRYTDYQPPRFFFRQAMRFEVGSTFNILKAMGARDVIDGDISGRIKLTGSELNPNTPGVYAMQAQVSNSKGDVSYLRFNVTMEQPRRPALEMSLPEYLIYIKRGSAFDPEAIAPQVTYAGQPVQNLALETHSGVNTGRPGLYTVQYLARDARGYSGETELAVVVEE